MSVYCLSLQTNSWKKKWINRQGNKKSNCHGQVDQWICRKLDSYNNNDSISNDNNLYALKIHE